MVSLCCTIVQTAVKITEHRGTLTTEKGKLLFNVQLQLFGLHKHEMLFRFHNR